ncbi:MAG TPA: hypothetical protein PKB09_03200 [Candidatus Saccharibacteria bacterium]|mgnify:CR=1 FL=1|nr:hypothetical protein [Candidatus Saccharibacteria bacterium]
MTNFEGLSPRQDRKAERLHRDYKKRAEKYGPDKIIGTRKATRHYKRHEVAYKQQAVLEANADGADINYPPYTERRLPESDQAPLVEYGLNEELGRQALTAHPAPETAVVSRHPSPELGSRTAN